MTSERIDIVARSDTGQTVSENSMQRMSNAVADGVTRAMQQGKLSEPNQPRGTLVANLHVAIVAEFLPQIRKHYADAVQGGIESPSILVFDLDDPIARQGLKICLGPHILTENSGGLHIGATRVCILPVHGSIASTTLEMLPRLALLRTQHLAAGELLVFVFAAGEAGVYIVNEYEDANPAGRIAAKRGARAGPSGDGLGPAAAG